VVHGGVVLSLTNKTNDTNVGNSKGLLDNLWRMWDIAPNDPQTGETDMALIDRRPCAKHGAVAEHCNGECMACNREEEDARQAGLRRVWASLTNEGKLDMLFKSTYKFAAKESH